MTEPLSNKEVQYQLEYKQALAKHYERSHKLGLMLQTRSEILTLMEDVVDLTTDKMFELMRGADNK